MNQSRLVRRIGISDEGEGRGKGEWQTSRTLDPSAHSQRRPRALPSRRALAASVVVIALVVLTTGPAAMASGWGPFTSTYNGNTVVDIRGNISMNGTIAVNALQLTDTRNDGNTVYAKGKWWKRFGSVWLFYGHEHTGEIENMSQIYTWTKNGASHQEVQGCAQLSWPVPDSCTDWKTLQW